MLIATMLTLSCLLWAGFAADTQPSQQPCYSYQNHRISVEGINNASLSDIQLFKSIVDHQEAPISSRLQLAVRGLIMKEGTVYECYSEQTVKDATIAEVVFKGFGDDLRKFKRGHPLLFEQLIDYINENNDVQGLIGQGSFEKPCTLIKPETIDKNFMCYKNFQKGVSRYGGNLFWREFAAFFNFETHDIVNCIVEAELSHENVNHNYRGWMLKKAVDKGVLDIYRTFVFHDEPFMAKTERVFEPFLKTMFRDKYFDVALHMMGAIQRVNQVWLFIPACFVLDSRLFSTSSKVLHGGPFFESHH